MYYSSHPQPVNTGILRVIIPDGWLVLTNDGPIIVPDPEHSWQTTNLLPAGTAQERVEAEPAVGSTEPTQEELDRQAEDQRRRAWALRCEVIQYLCGLNPTRNIEVWKPIAMDPDTGADRYVVETSTIRHPLIQLRITGEGLVWVAHGEGVYDRVSVRPWDGWLPVTIADEIEAMIAWVEDVYPRYCAALKASADEKQRAHDLTVQSGVWATAMTLEDLKKAQATANLWAATVLPAEPAQEGSDD